jgi:hypothetical protein
MAQRTTVVLIDDLDGGEAVETVPFGLDGVEYTIDVSARNAKKLRDAIAEFAANARRVGKMATKARRLTPSVVMAAKPERTLAETRHMNEAIRDWARAKGLSVANRGRIPADIVEQYKAAHAALL